jgi:urea transport system ATP-binding protein
MQPRVLLLDEPTEGIQPNIIEEIGGVIDYLKAKDSMAVVLVEQSFDFAWARADQVYVFRRGAVAPEGRKDALDKAVLHRDVSV